MRKNVGLGTIALVALGLVSAGGILARTFFPRVETEVRYRYVQVTPEAYAEDEPDTKVSLSEKVALPVREPEQVVVAPGAGKEEVEVFLADLPEPIVGSPAKTIIEQASAAPVDSATIMQRPKLIHSLLYRDRRLDLNTLTAQGDKVRFTYDGIHEPFQVIMNGGMPMVQSTRFGWWEEVKDHAGTGLVLVGVGMLIGVVVAN